MDTPKQAQMRTLAREALQAVKDKAWSNVEEIIIPHLLEQVSEFTTDIMSTLTNIDVEDEKAITMVHGIVRDGLLKEILRQITLTILEEADERITELFEK